MKSEDGRLECSSLSSMLPEREAVEGKRIEGRIWNLEFET